MDGRAISARPSDAVALAIRMGVPIRCTEELLDIAGVDFSEEEDVEVEKFRAFLDTINAEDFENPEEDGETVGRAPFLTIWSRVDSDQV